MTDSYPEETPGVDGLQFDEAEYISPRPELPVCGVCKREIADEYFEFGGQTFCSSCRAVLDEKLTGRAGRSARFLRAFLFGMLAAGAAGVVLYLGFTKLPNIGVLIAFMLIITGAFVGGAVRKGCQRRGGVLYQLLAVFFTYTAICAAWAGVALPPLIKDFANQAAKEPNPNVPKAKQHDAKAAKPAGPAQANGLAANRPSVGEFIFALIVVTALFVVLMYAVPIMAGINAPFTLLITAFALWEAWKLNRRVPVVFNGPFTVGHERASEQVSPQGVPGHA
jgi:hypothetical protein